MKLGKRLPVEPLDEERLTNIERRLVIAVSGTRPDAAARRPFTLVTAALAAALVLGVVLAWHRSPGPPPATAALVDRTAPVPAVEPVTPQHVEVTTEAEHSTLTLDDATIASDPSTKFDVTRSAGRVVVDITRGRLDLAVEHRAGRVLVIRAGDTEIEDIGTHFSVTFDGKTVDVRVIEGEVRVTRGGDATRVAAGSAWTTTRGLVALAELEPHVATLARMVPPARIVATSHLTVRPHNAEVSAPHVATVRADPYVELRAAIRMQPIAFDPKIDGKSDATGEIARLKLLAYSPTTVGAQASAALYRIAVLLHSPLGQDAAALNTLELYRKRFTNGKERTAAMWLRVRVACNHTIDEECRSAAYSYQREVPIGDAADVAVRITNAQ